MHEIERQLALTPAFRGVCAPLSNFYPARVQMGGLEYPTVEHAFAAAKTTDLAARERIRLAPSPGIAKRLGRQVALRPDWNAYRLELMTALVDQKFRHHNTPRNLLLATGDLEIVERNYWNDIFWGTCDGIGANHLGQILMQIRQSLKET